MLPPAPSPDLLIRTFDKALRTLTLPTQPERPRPGMEMPETELSHDENRHAAGLMRINHTGEICAQGLYMAQALVARNPLVRDRFAESAHEEEDHLAWTRARLKELDAKPSLLDPLWLGGSFLIGLAAGIKNDAHSLGFVAESEHQVESHLTDHLQQLPQQDRKSLAIVEQMRVDEARHALHAEQLGALKVPPPARFAMRLMANVMKTVAYRL